MTWGALASPEQTSPELLSSLPRDLRGETDPLISGSWPEWGLCWSSSAECSPGELACTSALVRRAGRTWHVQVCCCWDRSSAVGWAAGTWPWAPGWRQKPRPGEELPVGLLCQAPGVRLGKERAAPFRPGPCAWGCPPWSRFPCDRLPMKLCINDLKEIHTPSFVLRVFLVLLSKALRPGLALSAPFPSLRGWGAQVVTASGQVVPGLWGHSARDGGQRTRGSWALPAGARASAPAQVSPSASPRRGHMATWQTCGSARAGLLVRRVLCEGTEKG